MKFEKAANEVFFHRNQNHNWGSINQNELSGYIDKIREYVLDVEKELSRLNYELKNHESLDDDKLKEDLRVSTTSFIKKLSI